MNALRQQSLKGFVEKFWPEFSAPEKLELLPLSGDAGFRQYYRTDTSPTYIAVDSPPENEANLAYVNMNLLLADLGLKVPQIFAVDFSQGFFLLEDLGTNLLQGELSAQSADSLYSAALDQLQLIQSCAQKPVFVPEYSEKRLLNEMQLFSEWFLRGLLKIELNSKEQQRLHSLFGRLAEEALGQPKTLVHRDFHVRNLMCAPEGEVAVIDFQDAVWGPITYDLVSLGRDCYVRWSQSRLDEFVETCVDKLLEEGKIPADKRPCFRRWFDLMGLQRHIKVLGIFARLSIRDGKSGYLQDLPLVIRYVLEVMGQYPEMEDMAGWIESRVVPVCESQRWYSDWHIAAADRELN